MSRKATQEQNDISIIIGNLPQRLQKKIAGEVGLVTRPIGCDVAKAPATLRNTTPCVQVPRTSSCEDGARPPKRLVSRPGEGKQLAQKMSSGKSQKMPGKADDMQNDIAEGSTGAVGSSALPTKTNGVLIPGLLHVNANLKASTSLGQVKPTKSYENHQSSAHSSRSETMNDFRKLKLTNSSEMLRIARASPTVAWFNAPEVKHCNGLQQAYDQFTAMLRQGRVVKEWQSFLLVHEKLQTICRSLILSRMKFCCEQKVDTYFWKLLFYNVREHLKALKTAQATACIIALLDMGISFYACLETELIEKYLRASPQSERREKLLASSPSDCPEESSTTKLRFIAKLHIQKVLIWQGDLSRYKAKCQPKSDYSTARQFYTKAQRLIPTNGIPYNQLATTAILEHKQFDAVYFYMRSLMSSNAIHSAKESLLVLFDELRKKHEPSEMINSPIHHHKSKQANKSLRKEVWIYPDGVCHLQRNNVNGIEEISLEEDERISKLTTEELLRRFMSMYLYILGKLYTGIGMEVIQEHQRKLLTQLNALLDRQPMALLGNKLLKLAALNIFVVHHNMEKNSRESHCHAFRFCNQFCKLITRKTNNLLNNFIEQPAIVGENNRLTDLNSLLLFCNTYMDYLAKNNHLWEHIQTEEHLLPVDFIDMEQLLAHIMVWQRKGKSTALAEQDNRSSVLLPEDTFLSGFSPLDDPLAYKNSKHKYEYHTNEPVDVSSEEQFNERLVRLQQLLRQLDANRQLFDREAPADTVFVPTAINKTITTELQQVLQAPACDTDNQVINNGATEPFREISTSDGSSDKNNTNSQIMQLNNLKKQLEAKTHVKKMHNDKLEEILNYVDTKVYIEVRPKYLLPDTNCFIDCIDEFEKLASEFERYIFVIPLTVVKELDGLSKGVKMESYEKSLQRRRIHHFDEVSSRAKQSLNFIHKSRNNVKCATTKGSIINASLFSLVEEEHVSNDDKILATALALGKTMGRESIKDGKCFIQTELVLITSDRNLRVKALTRNLAVSELREFMFWAKNANR